MGGATNFGTDPAKARSIPFLTEVESIKAADAAAGGGLAAATDFCARPHAVTFALAEGVEPPAVGAAVHLETTGNGLVVVSNDRTLGAVADPQASALQGCLALDYRLTGRVTRVETRVVRARVSGERAVAA